MNVSFFCQIRDEEKKAPLFQLFNQKYSKRIFIQFSNIKSCLKNIFQNDFEPKFLPTDFDKSDLENEELINVNLN